VRALVLILLLALLGGCAAVPPAGPERDDWQARQQALGAMEAWTLNGRVAVQLNGEGWNAHLRWRQSDEAYRIRIYDPFGRTLAQIEGDATGASLRSAEGWQREAATPEALMDAEFGWHLPLTGMRHWLRGVPATGPVESLQLDDQGRPLRLVQAGWQLDYGAYASAHPLALPTRMDLAQEGVSVRLVVSDWQQGAP